MAQYTLHYQQQGLLDCLQHDVGGAAKNMGPTVVIKDMDREFMRALRRFGQALRPPTHSQDWEQEVASLLWTFRNKTPTSQRRSTDYFTVCSGNLPAKCYRLMQELPRFTDAVTR